MRGYRPPLDQGGYAVRVLLRGRPGVRGAMFVEAVIVIAFFVVALTGLMYFKEYYGKELRSMRLARAAAIAYSMGACQDGVNTPDGWIDKDKGSLVPQASPHDVDQDPKMSGAMNQNSTQQSQGSADKGGAASIGNKLNEMVMTVFSGEATIREKRGPLAGGTKDIIKGTVRARSYVSCGDRVRKGTWEEMVKSILSVFSSFWS
jgi:hypothetical protein